MKFRSLFAVVTMAASILSGSAFAAWTPNYSAPTRNLGVLTTDGSETYNYSGTGGTQNLSGVYGATLNPNTIVTFTFTASPQNSSAGLTGLGYAEKYYRSLYPTSIPTINSEVTSTTGGAYAETGLIAAANGLVFASANLTSAWTGTIIFKNLTDSTIKIAAAFQAFLNSGTNLLVTWDVETVPLPAALPLFGLGLAGLAGYARKRKTVKS